MNKNNLNFKNFKQTETKPSFQQPMTFPFPFINENNKDHFPGFNFKFNNFQIPENILQQSYID
jgi:hypothetical protein